jgi:hypothetical protein
VAADRDLEALEKATFRAATDDGTWDVVAAGFVAMFAIAPLLSSTLGDFWSSAVFVPAWGALYLAVRLVRARVITPRIGVVRFGPPRTRRLRRFATTMLAVNVIAFFLGIGAVVAFQEEWIKDGSLGFPLVLTLTCLVIFSMAAFTLGIPRYYGYGLMLAAAPLVGEWLWRRGLASHHGYPIVFGVAATVMAAAGILRLIGQMRHYPSERVSPEGRI